MKRFSIWNFYARAYDVINKNVPYLKMLDEIIKEVQISGNLKILDAGCGTGNLLKKMSQVSFNSKFVGVDSSEQMLSRAKKKFLSNPSVTLHHTDLDKGLEFMDGSFDRIVSVNTLYALDNPKEIISEFNRLLKPLGKLVFTNPHNKAKFSAIIGRQFQELGLFNFIIKFLLNLPALFIIIFVNIVFIRKNKNYWSKSETLNILTTHGFKDIDIKLTYADQNLLVRAIKI